MTSTSDREMTVAEGQGTWTHPGTGEVFQNDYRLGEQPGPIWRCHCCDSKVMTYNAPLDARGSATEKRIRLLHDQSCPTIADPGPVYMDAAYDDWWRESQRGLNRGH